MASSCIKINIKSLNLIDDGGDAHEALEECYDMIQYLSNNDESLIHKAHLFHIQKRGGDTKYVEKDDE